MSGLVVLDRVEVPCAQGCVHGFVVASVGGEDRWAAVQLADDGGWLRAAETVERESGMVAAANMVALLGVPRARLDALVLEQWAALASMSIAVVYAVARMETVQVRALSDAVFPWSPAGVIAACRVVVEHGAMVQ